MLCPMNWKTIIAELNAAGLSQGKIADLLCISQPSVSDIANGKTKNPSWQIGDALLKLHRKEVRRARAKAAA